MLASKEHEGHRAIVARAVADDVVDSGSLLKTRFIDRLLLVRQVAFLLRPGLFR